MKKLILTSVFTLLGIITNAQEKELLTTTMNGDEIYIYSNIVAYPNIMSGDDSRYYIVWTDFKYRKPQHNEYNNKDYIFSAIQWMVDCEEKRISITSEFSKSEDGNIVSHFMGELKEAEQALEPVSPESIGWEIIKETCKRGSYLK